MKRCPTCTSPDPKKHPAMQFEGEVQLCSDPWHKPTAEEIQRSMVASAKTYDLETSCTLAAEKALEWAALVCEKRGAIGCAIAIREACEGSTHDILERPK